MLLASLAVQQQQTLWLSKNEEEKEEANSEAENTEKIKFCTHTYDAHVDVLKKT